MNRLIWGPSYGPTTKLDIGEGYNWTIYGAPDNLNHFLTTAVSPLVVTEERETRTGNKKQHSRRRYVGDPNPINVDPHTFDYLYDPGRKVGSALPGWSFILDDGVEKRQFTTTGDVQTLILYLDGNVKQPTKVYTGGAVTTVNPAEENG